MFDRLGNLCLFCYLIAVFHRAEWPSCLRAVHVYCRQIARFLCVCLSQRGRLFLGQIRQNAEARTEIGLPSSDRALYSDKARSFNQSEHALYRSFIIYRDEQYRDSPPHSLLPPLWQGLYYSIQLLHATLTTKVVRFKSDLPVFIYFEFILSWPSFFQISFSPWSNILFPEEHIVMKSRFWPLIGKVMPGKG